MIRAPLRPLVKILAARAKGQNPDDIERQNIQARTNAMRETARAQAAGRLLMLGAAFLMCFGTVGMRMGQLASADPAEPTLRSSGARMLTQRADIVDRHGRILATNMETYALYAQTRDLVDPARAAAGLAQIFPDLNADDLLQDFTGKRSFVWVRKKLSASQRQAVHDLGEPGLLFGPREMRVYPNGRLASHVLGGAGFGREAVYAAEIKGLAGIESFYDDTLRDPARADDPLQLSLDLSAQAAIEKVLAGGMRMMQAKGAAGILMNAHSGEIIALASLPDFDPNNRPLPPRSGDPSDSPIFNRAVQGVYELGSTFKIFAAAQAMQMGLFDADDMIDTKGPLRWGRFKIRDFHNYGPKLSLQQVIEKSSNIGTARVAQKIGAEAQQDFLRQLGFFEPVALEMPEARVARPILPKNWSELSTMTISYGHGLSASPLHLAAAYAAIANGGKSVRPTLIKGGSGEGTQIISAKVAQKARAMLRGVVTQGTASMAQVPGYAVAGKTGTADKPARTGGYHEDKVITTFASMFPADNPEYVLVISLDEPVETSGLEARRTAGWTAVPVAAEVISRVAPLLGLRPDLREFAALN